MSLSPVLLPVLSTGGLRLERKGPRYKVEREIGRGAFGVVYLANDNLLQRKVDSR